MQELTVSDVKKDNPGIAVFDVFCGIGGLSYGLKKAGLRVVGGLDVDSTCQFAYESNCEAPFLVSDIKRVTYETLPQSYRDAEYKVLVGCAPCQPFSPHTHKRHSRYIDPRWDLINHFLRLVEEGRPEIISMENVPSLSSEPIYTSFRRKLVEIGYYLSSVRVCCSEFGVPQRRRRLVLLGSRLGDITYSPPKNPKLRSVRDAIGQLSALKPGASCPDDPVHVCSHLSTINYHRIVASKPGGNWLDWPASLLPDCFLKESGRTYKNVYGRMEWDKVSPTLTTQFYKYGTGRFGHPEQNRAISLREGALLQSFPIEYRFCPTNVKPKITCIGRHIGNAVPPLLGTHIGLSIREHINQTG